MQKKGISAVIATVLMILITITAVVILWTFIIPLIKNNISFSPSPDLTIDVSGGFTNYDPNSERACIEVKRGVDKADIIGIWFTINAGGNSYTTYNDTVPGINQAKIYCFDTHGLPIKLDSFEIAPVFRVGKTYKVGAITSRVEEIPEADLSDIDYPILPLDGIPPTSCSSGQTKVCTILLGVGVCGSGIRNCVDGYFNQRCNLPNYEIIESYCSDALDNDCDGKADCADETCASTLACAACVVGDPGLSCYNGPLGTSGVGICQNGTQPCVAGQWGTCSGEQAPLTEICNDNSDNDCDGKKDCADENCTENAACEQPTVPPITGYVLKGCTTAFDIDEDCDGYGVGPNLLPDADDSDGAVHNATNILTKFGWDVSTDSGMRLWVQHLGYPNPSNIITMDDPEDNEGTLSAGNLVVYRSGEYTGMGKSGGNLNGAPGNPIVFLAYPGEVVTSNNSWGGISIFPYDPNTVSNLVFDGFSLVGAKDSGGVRMRKVSNISFKNLEIIDSGNQRGVIGEAQGTLNNISFDGCVFANSGGEHLFYLGTDQLQQTGDYDFEANPTSKANRDISVRDCLFYFHNNGNPAVQFNGLTTRLIFENNQIHSNGGASLALYNGVSNSIIRNNIIFNGGKQGIVLKIGDPADGRLNNLYNNTIAGNVIWHGNTAPYGYSVSQVPYWSGLWFDTAYSGYRYHDFNISNNIFVTYDGSGIVYMEKATDFESNFNVVNNIFYKNGAAYPNVILSYGGNYFDGAGVENYNVTSLLTFSSNYVGNVYTNPNFQSASTSYYNNAGAFNFTRI